jgi:sugar/nucleoside kinase (ribokinase family)
MAAMLQSLPEGQTPAFLTIGHVTRDLLPGQGFALGGTVTFAALTASRLGLAAALVTCADEGLLAQLPAFLPGVALAARPAPLTTTFENSYLHGFRTQYLRERAPLLAVTDIPPAWLSAPLLLLAPLAQEITLELVRALERPAGSLLAATPQGWLRRWDEDGRVWPTPWEQAEELLPLLDVLILSHDDLLPFAGNRRDVADAMLTEWSLRVPLLIATDGRAGATLFEQGKSRRFPAYPAREVDPTGAGDVFAAAFLTYFYQHRDPYEAVNFANCVASLSVEHPGISGIPTPEQIQARLRPLAR